MIDEKTFPSLYYTSPDVEAQQGPKLQSALQKLWLAHHDDYAPQDKKVAVTSTGGNGSARVLIDNLHRLAGKAMQDDMNILNQTGPS